MGDYSSHDFLANRVEDFAFVVSTQDLMDGGQILDDGLLQDPQADTDRLQVLGTSRHRDINRLQPAIINDGFLSYRIIT